jgi:prepilin-type N-terminal cleavage/methylation domain-containing protein
MNVFNKAKGFSLLEVVVVMVVTSFLAITAVPMIMGTIDTARASTLQGIASAMAAANESMKNKAMMDQTDSLEGGVGELKTEITVDGEQLETTYGWLAAEVRNMSALVDLDLKQAQTLTTIKATDPGSDFHVEKAGDSVFITFAGRDFHIGGSAAQISGDGTAINAVGVSTCYVQYTAAISEFDKPDIYVEVSGC